MIEIENGAKLYRPGQAQVDQAKVRLIADSTLVIKIGQGIQYQYSKSKLKITDRLASLEREIGLPDGTLLMLPNTPEINQWLDAGNKLDWLYGLEQKTRYVIASLILAPLILFAMFRFVFPAMAVQFAHWVPDAYVELASQHTLSALDGTVLEPSQLKQEQIDEYLHYWQRTVSQLNLNPNDYQIGFRHSETIGPNAFALPNGQIIITDQLVELLDGDRDVLQAIVLHEIGHVEHRHSMRMIAQSLATSVVVSYLFGDLSGVAELFVGASSTLVHNKFSQDLEWEADNFALEKLSHIEDGEDDFAKAMQKFAELVGHQANAEEWLSSHPSLEKRIANAIRANGETGTN